MPKLGLRPYAVIEEGLDQYLAYNFNRLENVFERMQDVVTGVISVTGQQSVATGLASVSGVVAAFTTDPSAGAAFLSCVPAAQGQITIRVLTNGFALSIIAVSVRWIAVGELVLS